MSTPSYAAQQRREPQAQPIAESNDSHGAEHPLHGSLVRQTLYLGVERTVIALEATQCLAVLFGVGFSLATIALVALILFVIHPIMVWVTAKDSQATEIAIRSRAYGDFYAPHAPIETSARGRTPRPRPSLPGRR